MNVKLTFLPSTEIEPTPGSGLDVVDSRESIGSIIVEVLSLSLEVDDVLEELGPSARPILWKENMFEKPSRTS